MIRRRQMRRSYGLAVISVVCVLSGCSSGLRGRWTVQSVTPSTAAAGLGFSSLEFLNEQTLREFPPFRARARAARSVRYEFSDGSLTVFDSHDKPTRRYRVQQIDQPPTLILRYDMLGPNGAPAPVEIQLRAEW